MNKSVQSLVLKIPLIVLDPAGETIPGAKILSLSSADYPVLKRQIRMVLQQLDCGEFFQQLLNLFLPTLKILANFSI
jgi:hypothetical protein